MEKLGIFINGDNCWPDLKMLEHKTVREKLSGIARIPGGMASGKSSVTFRVDLPDGGVVLAQTSMDLFLYAAMLFSDVEE